MKIEKISLKIYERFFFHKSSQITFILFCAIIFRSVRDYFRGFGFELTKEASIFSLICFVLSLILIYRENQLLSFRKYQIDLHGSQLQELVKILNDAYNVRCDFFDKKNKTKFIGTRLNNLISNSQRIEIQIKDNYLLINSIDDPINRYSSVIRNDRNNENYRLIIKLINSLEKKN